MEENHKEIDRKTKSEVGALFQDCVVEPLTLQLKESQNSAAAAEKQQFENVQEILEKVNTTAKGIRSDTKNAVQNKTLEAAKEDILNGLSLQQGAIEEGISKARNTITNQMTASFTGAGQKMDALSKQVDAGEEEVLEQLMEQGEQTRDAMTSGFAGAEQRMDEVSRQLGRNEAKLQQLAEQNEQTRDAMTSGFAGAEQRMDEVSRQLGRNEAKLQQLAEQNEQTRDAMTCGFASVEQKTDEVSRQLGRCEAKLQQQLTEQNKQARDVMTGGFFGAEQKIGAVSRQLEGSEAKVLEQLVEQNKQTRDVMTSGFVGAEQKLDALSQQVDADEEKVLEQLAVIVQQLTENAASSSTQLTQYQQNLQTEMETGKSDLTEAAMQKYKVLLGVSISFGIVNFLGVVALLIINLMP